VKDSHQKLVIVGFLLLVLIGIGTTKVLGSKQDQTFVEQNEKYQIAVQYIQVGKYQESSAILQELYKSNPESNEVLRLLGFVSGATGDFVKAANYLQKAVDQKPFLLQDHIFNLQFGEVWYFLGELEKSKAYLEKSKQLDVEAQYHERIDELLATIEQTTK
jgi:predicted Zn-dependent protease